MPCNSLTFSNHSTLCRFFSRPPHTPAFSSRSILSPSLSPHFPLRKFALARFPSVQFLQFLPDFYPSLSCPTFPAPPPDCRFTLAAVWCVAVGCADLELPVHSAAHVIRSDDTTDVICNDSWTTSSPRRGGRHEAPPPSPPSLGPGSSSSSSDHRRHHRHRQPVQSWRLICHGTQWIGDYGNCTRRQRVVGDDDVIIVIGSDVISVRPSTSCDSHRRRRRQCRQ